MEQAQKKVLPLAVSQVGIIVKNREKTKQSDDFTQSTTPPQADGI